MKYFICIDRESLYYGKVFYLENEEQKFNEQGYITCKSSDGEFYLLNDKRLKEITKEEYFKSIWESNDNERSGNE